MINTNIPPELEELYSEMNICRQCPINTRAIPELGWGEVGKIMFVGQCPAPSNKRGDRGTSDFDKYFFKLLEPMGITPDDFFFTNLVKVPVKMQEIDGDTLEHCAEHVKEEIKIVKPKIVLALGKYAYQYLKKANVRCYSVMHPGAIKYGNATEEQWREGLLETFRKVKFNHKKGN